ncbi:MAG: hypothetical protein M3Y91_07195 [Actinomycetota bacterium]|nr:hypothetical protein [Actinomycetota bacterium]
MDDVELLDVVVDPPGSVVVVVVPGPGTVVPGTVVDGPVGLVGDVVVGAVVVGGTEVEEVVEVVVALGGFVVTGLVVGGGVREYCAHPPAPQSVMPFGGPGEMLL